MSKGTLLYKIAHEGTGLNHVLKLLGIETHTEIFTDIQISDLLTPGEADKSARRNAKYVSKGIAADYFSAYKGFQRDYRKKYSAQFMKRQGYAPNSTATTRVNSITLTKEYIQNIYGYADVSVESSIDKYLTLTERYNHAIRTVSGYDFPTGQIIISGEHYNNHTYVQGVDETVVIITSTRLYDETIIDNLTNNYAYDGTNITYNGELYVVGEISDVLNGSNEYETVCTHPTLASIVIQTPRQQIVNTITNAVYGSETSYAKYRVLSGEVGTELRYWVAVADTAPIYINSVIDITAIIPVKEDNQMVDLEARKLTRMLRKLNISGDQLRTSIDNPDMDSAYLMTGLNPQRNDSVSNLVMFNVFDYMTSGNGNINISISKLSMRYQFGINKATISGSIGPVGTVTRTNIAQSSTTTGTGESEGTTVTQAGMTLRVQVDTNEYREITITDFSQTYTLSGESITTHLDSTGGYTRIVLPLEILNKLKYKDFVHIYERSLCLLAYSVEAVEIEWYETAAFGTLLKIVAIVIFIYTLGTASSVSAALWSMASSAAIMFAASYIAKAIGGTVGAIVGAIVAIVAMYYNPLGTTMTDTELWLNIATQAVGVVNQSIAMKMDELVANSEAFMREMTAKFEELAELMEGRDDFNPYGYTEITSNYAGTSNNIYRTIEDYCAEILEGADMDYLIDYGRQIEYNINTRNSVFSGVSN